MKTINLCSLEKSDVQYRIDRFPDGETQFVITEDFDRKDNYLVICRITSADELFILMQVGDILDRQEVVWSLKIKYLMGMRMDRVMSFERPFTLKVVAKMISSMGYNTCMITAPHSDMTTRLIRNSVGMEEMPKEFINDHDALADAIIVYPDHGAMTRYSKYSMSDIEVYFDKARDIATGKIKSFVLHDQGIVPWTSCNHFLFYDDLCDAGGTFLGELAVLKEKYPNAKYSIHVTHLVNERGLDNLANNFDTVYITDSYRDWRPVVAEKGYKNVVIV